MPETEIIFSVQESPEGGCEARALGHDIFTQGETMDELRANAKAVARHFGDRKIPPPFRLVKARPKGRTLSLAKGQFTVPDDFNEPLLKQIEDLFWE